MPASLKLLERVTAHLSKGGGGWIELSVNVPKELAGDEDFLAPYGVKNRKTTRTQVAGGVTHVVTAVN